MFNFFVYVYYAVPLFLSQTLDAGDESVFLHLQVYGFLNSPPTSLFTPQTSFTCVGLPHNIFLLKIKLCFKKIFSV